MRGNILRRLLPLFILLCPLAPARASHAPETEIWRIGLCDGACDEFGADGKGALEYAVPADWATRKKWGDFQGVWESAGGNNISHQISFSLDGAVEASYLELGILRADSEAYACRVAINGVTLAAQWIGGQGRAAANGHAGPVTRVFWAVPANALRADGNILSIWNPRENDGHNLADADRLGSVFLDYLRLVAGEKNVYKPLLRGAGIWWLTKEAGAYGRSIGLGGKGSPEGFFHYGEGTFDDDLEILKLWKFDYINTGIVWAFLEREKGQWNQELLDEYEYQFKTLNDLGVKTWVALQYAPKWASNRADREGDGAAFFDYPPAKLEDWVDFCRFTAEHFGKFVDNWLIGGALAQKPFFAGTPAEYLTFFQAARATFRQYDTIDADGDGIDAQTAPGVFACPGDDAPEDCASFLAREAAPLFDSIHYQDFAWGDYKLLQNYQRLFPKKKFFLDAWGSAFWSNETKCAYEQMIGWSYPPRQPFSGEPLDEMRYLRFFQEPEVALDGYAVWMLKGDPNGDYPPGGDGANCDCGNCWIDAEPGGKYIVTEGGAYAQHYQWLYSYDGPVQPLAVEYPDDAFVLADAVWAKNRLQILATNFAAPGEPAVKVTLRAPAGDGLYRVVFFNPYYPVGEEKIEAKDGWLTVEVTLETGERTRTVRMEVVKC